MGTPDPGAFWRVIAQHGVRAPFTAPTALRAIKKQDPDGTHLQGHDLLDFKYLFLAGERLDPDTYQWARKMLKRPVADPWWQTETGETLAAELRKSVREEIGAVACFHDVAVVQRLPKTRSGKVLRGTMRQIADGKDFRVPSTIDDPSILDDVTAALHDLGYPRRPVRGSPPNAPPNGWDGHYPHGRCPRYSYSRSSIHRIGSGRSEAPVPARLTPAPFLWLALAALAAALVPPPTRAWSPLPVAQDPLVRLPGTQPGQVTLEGPSRCLNCHQGYGGGAAEPGHWQGSMMAQAGRDFLFWATLTVAAQDSIWAVGRPNGTDLCLRCHSPEGWLEGRSDPTNGSAFGGSDFDGVHCDSCHRLYDPFFETTFAGTREGNDWSGYWDETDASDTPSDAAAQDTYDQDLVDSAAVLRYDGGAFYDAAHLPFSPAYTENAGGQLFVSSHAGKRAPFADVEARHDVLYSRYHKSRYFCSTCHDVSNPLFEHLPFDGTAPGDGTTILPSEEDAAFSYGHVERTFSEFLLSAYGAQGGAPGEGPWAPGAFDTSLPGDAVARCQDCHLPDVAGKASKQTTVTRPGATEHPKSGVPAHDLTGANAWVARVLASAVSGSPNYDATNDALLNQGAAVLTVDQSQGLGVPPAALLAGAQRAEATLARAAALADLQYDPTTGELEVKVVNYTGHKLLSGYPEGRRMFLNLKLFAGGELIHEVNPYSAAAGTLAGLPGAPSSPPLAAHEAYRDDLVYEMRTSSSLTGGGHTFHFLLADAREKDNRIPPKGFRIVDAAARLVVPVTAGVDDPDRFSAEEYAGGYDEAEMVLPTGADRVEARLFYQTTSREYVEFLRDEINGTASTLSSPTPSGEPEAYVAQTDPFFSALAAWGDTVWQLWLHNKDLPGAAPILMAEASLDTGGGGGCTPGLTLDDDRTVTTTETYASCDVLTAGPFHVASPGNVTFEAPTTIVLQDGFSVGSEASFRAVIDPGLALSSSPP